MPESPICQCWNEGQYGRVHREDCPLHGPAAVCNCATYGSAAHCPVHTQADYDAAERPASGRILGVPLEQIDRVYVSGQRYDLRFDSQDRDPYITTASREPAIGGRGWDEVLVLDFGWWTRRIRVRDIQVIETKEPTSA